MGIQNIDRLMETAKKIYFVGIGGISMVSLSLLTAKKGYTVALASSTRTAVVYKELKEAGLFDYFKTITCGDMVMHSKPDPEIYLKACKSVNVEPYLACCVEDSPNGIMSAYNAGMKPLMVPDQIEPSADLIQKLWKLCKSLKDLENIF